MCKFKNYFFIILWMFLEDMIFLRKDKGISYFNSRVRVLSFYRFYFLCFYF